MFDKKGRKMLKRFKRILLYMPWFICWIHLELSYLVVSLV